MSQQTGCYSLISCINLAHPSAVYEIVSFIASRKAIYGKQNATAVVYGFFLRKWCAPVIKLNSYILKKNKAELFKDIYSDEQIIFFFSSHWSRNLEIFIAFQQVHFEG